MLPSMVTFIYPFCLISSFIQDYVAIDVHFYLFIYLDIYCKFNLSILSDMFIYIILCCHLWSLLFIYIVCYIYSLYVIFSFIQDYAAINGRFNLSILSEIINDCM